MSLIASTWTSFSGLGLMPKAGDCTRLRRTAQAAQPIEIAIETSAKDELPAHLSLLTCD